LRYVFESDKVRNALQTRDVPVNSDDACRDVEKYLRASFVEIRDKYRPSASQRALSRRDCRKRDRSLCVGTFWCRVDHYCPLHRRSRCL
jgi:hypothetical protein